MSDNEIWSYQLDWLNIIKLLGLKSIIQIPEDKKQKAIKKVTKLYGTELLLNFKPTELDELVANELRDLMKKELMNYQRKQERIEKETRAKVMPFKRGGIIGIDMRDLDIDPNADPEEILRYLTKKFLKGEDDDKDDDRDRIDEDRTGYYI
ncbi:MAG: hypothetical protein ACFFD5_16795 [Candidatus Thorarchaeota archaeon]